MGRLHPIALVLVLAGCAGTPEEEHDAARMRWSYTEAGDTQVAHVDSVDVFELAPPCTGPQRATLSIRQHPTLGADVVVRVRCGRFECAPEGCTFAVRFDDDATVRWPARPSQGRTSLQLDGAAGFIARMRRATLAHMAATVEPETTLGLTFRVAGFDPLR